MTRTLSTALVILVYLLLLIGATVRVMGAGMACPDWPKCNGEWIPAFDPLVFAEWFHRLLVLIVALVVLTQAAIVAFSRELRKQIGGLTLAAVVLLLTQAGLGAVTVFENNSPVTVAAHLLLGAIFFGVIIWIRRALPPPLNQPLTPTLSPKGRGGLSTYRNHIYMALTILFIQLGLGALVSSSHAGLVCPDFPTCNGLWFPPMEGLVGLQMAHRFMGYAVVLIMVGTFFVGRKAVTSSIDRRMLKWALATVIIQILLGIGLIHANIPMAMSVIHLGLAMVLWGLLVGLVYGSGGRAPVPPKSCEAPDQQSWSSPAMIDEDKNGVKRR